MKKFFSIAILAAATAGQAGAQESTKLKLEPGTELSITGTSTVHGFTCKTNRIDATLVVDKGYTSDLTKIAKPIVSVRVEIPVKSLDCGNNGMNNNMFKTLNADKNPTIVYTLGGYDLMNGTSSSFGARTTGTLLIAGTEKTRTMEIKAERIDDNKATAKGEHSILLTDFGIKPPSFMLGTLKVGNEIKIKFNLKAGPAMIAQIAAAMTAVETQ